MSGSSILNTLAQSDFSLAAQGVHSPLQAASRPDTNHDQPDASSQAHSSANATFAQLSMACFDMSGVPDPESGIGLESHSTQVAERPVAHAQPRTHGFTDRARSQPLAASLDAETAELPRAEVALRQARLEQLQRIHVRRPRHFQEDCRALLTVILLNELRSRTMDTPTSIMKRLAKHTSVSYKLYRAVWEPVMDRLQALLLADEHDEHDDFRTDMEHDLRS